MISKPYSVPCCGKIYCKKCIDEWLKQKKSCPNCRKPLNENQIIEEKTLLVKKEICEQIINCNQNCNWSGKFEKFITHLKSNEHHLKWPK